MNRWRWAALAVIAIGLAVSFFLIPYSSGACDDGGTCGAGPYLRVMAVMLTVLVGFIFVVVGALTDAADDHRRT
jgi:uncharacterized membrane protein